MSFKHIYCIGFYGAPNIGDELLCSAVVNEIHRHYPQSAVYVQTLNKNITTNYTGLNVECIEGFWPSPEYFANLRAHLKAAAECDLAVIGGGGLLADYYSWGAIPQYLMDVLWAIRHKKPIIFVGLGVRDIHRWWLRQLAKFVVCQARAIYCRDSNSASLLTQLSGRTDIITGPDLGHIAAAAFPKPAVSNYTLLSLRAKPPISMVKVTALCEELLKSSDTLVFLSAENSDTEYYESIMPHLGNAASRARIVAPKNLEEAITYIQAAKNVVAERLHVNLIAAYAQRPLLTVCYESKVKNMIESVYKKPLVCSMDTIGVESVRQLALIEMPELTDNFKTIADNAALAFEKTIRIGLQNESKTQMAGIRSLLWFFSLVFIGMAWSGAVILKRILCLQRPIRKT
jgi:O-antigen biosynthesis protein